MRGITDDSLVNVSDFYLDLTLKCWLQGLDFQHVAIAAYPDGRPLRQRSPD